MLPVRGAFLNAQPTVVVADDFAPLLRKLVSLLCGSFDIVATARCGKAALEAIDTYHPDAAVMDLNLPNVNGIEVIRALAKQPSSPPVVICSVSVLSKLAGVEA